MDNHIHELEAVIEERIDQVLRECEYRQKKHYEKEEAYLSQLEDSVKEKVEKLLEDILQWNYEDCRTVYCAGIEDGIRIARKIFTI